jgi:hypothetical protein
LQENAFLVYAILRSKKRFEALRAFTLESGQHEIERQNQQRKANSSGGDIIASPALSHSGDEIRGSARRQLSHVPEEGTFAIGDDESDEEAETQNTPLQSSPSIENSRTPSVSSSADDSVPLQLRGMSEKARGKMPASQTSFSRQNSTTSLGSYAAAVPATSSGFVPTTSWVRSC